MSWTLLLALVLGLGAALCALLLRRHELARMQEHLAERERVVRSGGERAQLQHPVVDLSRCLGCGACVRACPEEGVLEMVHGQAMVVNGARCTGVTACERVCPVGAIQVRLADLETRTDIPALSESLEAFGTPGLFLAGEVTAHARIRTAVEHGFAVGREVAQRSARAHTLARAPSLAREAVLVGGGGEQHDASESVPGEGPLDLVIVGAGPAGLACALEAQRAGLDFLLVEQEQALGGTVAKYPRRKLVLTEPVVLSEDVRLDRASYSKEELIEFWREVVDRAGLAIETGITFEGLERDAQGVFHVHSSRGTVHARHVCLAIGRRGLPRRLGIPGEELPNVAYALLDAQSFEGRRVLVVGGGDSALEAALALAEQPGNLVRLAYRGASFHRARARVVARLDAAESKGKLEVLRSTELRAIALDRVHVEREGEDLVLENDDVFVFAGGEAPVELLQRSGVSFDPALRPKQAPVVEQGTGLVRALATSFVLALAALAWAFWHSDYYLLPRDARATHVQHSLLRPGMGIGLWFGICATALVALNLLYLARRAAVGRWALGSLPSWMTVHVATGIVALVAATLHAAMAAGDSLGGHALWMLAALLATGAIGRYVYAWVPRAANGRELELSEVKRRLEGLVGALDPAQRAFAERARGEVLALVEVRRWRSNVLLRIAALPLGQRALRAVLRRLAAEARAQRIPEATIHETLELSRQAWRTALAAAHYEDLRGVLSSWRWFHRWMAVLLVVLLGLHIAYAWVYAQHLFGGSTP
ncbi:MAG: NAD(P)-binding domain-containing protein [Planctomycetes bacterium]|nr:NAD(P)-binding domain-containing protein [Planctomycetota bacterium]